MNKQEYHVLFKGFQFEFMDLSEYKGAKLKIYEHPWREAMKHDQKHANVDTMNNRNPLYWM